MGAFDLQFTREVPVAPELLYRGWTDPELMVQWFTPAPWITTSAEVDAIPGGRFANTMQGPDGSTQSGSGCVLVAEPGRRLVWTTTMQEGFVPASAEGIHFSAELLFEPIDGGTRYTARVIHGNAADMEQHAAMGFEAGWNAALDQLVALVSK